MSKKFIQVNDELRFYLPTPPIKSEIAFSNLPKKDQYWRPRHDIPEIYFDWNEGVLNNQPETVYEGDRLVSLSVDDTIELEKIRDRELLRRQRGYHFMNNGVITYLTGNNYNFLTYYHIPGVGLPHYREFQRDIFYVIEIAVLDPDCVGAFIAKAKKTGVTHIMCSVFLNEATMIRDRSFGMMNKTETEAKNVNMQFFWQAYEKLPPIMQPMVHTHNLGKVIFDRPAVRTTGSEKQRIKLQEAQKNKSLKTWIYTAATKKEVAFDGPIMYFIHMDEFPKWKVSPKAIFNKITETVKLQQTIVGKIFITSYPPEEDSISYREAKKIYYDSKLSTKKGGTLDRTKSGLICHFVSALVSTDGTFDRYGVANTAKALQLNQAERDNCDDQSELQAKIRQYCRTEEECWREGGTGSTFDNIHLSLAQTFYTERTLAGHKVYVEGNLEWESGFGSNVYFVPLTAEDRKAGKIAYWRMFEMPFKRDRNRFLTNNNGERIPYSDCKYFSGTDTTEYKRKSKVVRSPSIPAIVMMSHYDVERNTALEKPASNRIACTYYGRKENPDDFIDDWCKTHLFFGAYGTVEGNKAWVITELEKEEIGMKNFLILKQKDGSFMPYLLGNLNRAITTGDNMIEHYCRLITNYIKWPINESDIDYCLWLLHPEIISQLMSFDPSDTQIFDYVVALGYALITREALIAVRYKLQEEEKKLNAIAAFAGVLAMQT